jgi:hypothetical protein
MYPKTTLGLLGAAGLIAAGVVLAGRGGGSGATSTGGAAGQ